MPKKWYNLFVTVEPGPEGGSGEGAATPAGRPAQTVADIAASLGEPKFSGTVADPNSFDDIYAAAEIAPPTHGYTIYKVAEMLHSEHIRNLPAGVKKSSVLVALDAAGVKAADVVEDAVRRDRALDTFERVQQKSLDELGAKKKEDNERIQAEMDRIVAEHRARIQANNDQVAKANEAFRAWCLQKQQEEQKIFDAVSYFVTDNPITTSSQAEPPPSNPKGKS